MPVYDCGDPDCDECKREFGPDRSRAIAKYHAREKEYAAYERAERRTAQAKEERITDRGSLT
jgi:hypothetical protein